jgi:hypothetical protein
MSIGTISEENVMLIFAEFMLKRRKPSIGEGRGLGTLDFPDQKMQLKISRHQ